MVKMFVLEKGVCLPSNDHANPVWLDVSGFTPHTFPQEIPQQESYLKQHFPSEWGKIHHFVTRQPKHWRLVEKEFICEKLILMNPAASHKYELLVLILFKDKVITLHNTLSSLFEPLIHNSALSLQNSTDLLYEMVNLMINWNAEILEAQTYHLDEVSFQLFHPQSEILPLDNRFLQKMTLKMGQANHLIMKIQKSFDTLERFVEFFLVDPLAQEIGGKKATAFRERMHQIETEIEVLQRTVASLSNNLSYMSNVSLGIVGINQNETSRFLSTLATVLAPPSLIASIYNVRFDDMPSASWIIGFLSMFFLMILTALVFYRNFKKRELD